MIPQMKGMKGKKAQVTSEYILLMWRMLLIAAVVFVIAWSVGKVYTSKQDIRMTESALFAKSAIECIGPEGIVKADFDLSGCFANIDKSQYFISAKLSSLESNLTKESVFGTQNIRTNCELGKEYGGNAPKCTDWTVYVLIDNNGKTERGKLEVYSAIYKLSSNVQNK